MLAGTKLPLLRTLFCCCVLATTASLAVAQANPPAPQPPLKEAIAPSVTTAWDELLQGSVAERPSEAQAPLPRNDKDARTSGTGDFLNHFYLDARTEYSHSEYSFSGQPTNTGIINGSTEGLSGGHYVFPDAFQSGTNTAYGFLNFGTHGWGSDRVNTNVTLRYRQDITSVPAGSPGLSVINTFPGNRVFEVVSGNFEINGKTTDGFFSDSSVRIGRQSFYGAELASFDGVSFTHNRRKYSFTLYGGRRFTYYSAPDQRGIGGVDFVYRPTEKISLGYQALWYVKGSHVFSYRQRLTEDWLIHSAFKLVGSHPVNFDTAALWAPSNGRTIVGVSFFQKLSNRDYFYDYTTIARDFDPNNPELRLYFGPISQYSQFGVDARRTVNSKVRLGAGLVVRRLNDSKDQAPFDTSFADYRVNAQVFPWRKVDTFLEYHEHDSDRSAAMNNTYFADITYAGETKIQDFTAEVGRSFFENRVNLKGGGFFRRINFQDRFFVINNAQDKGWLGSAALRVDSKTRVYFNYSLDTDFYVWRPSIKNGQVFRLGMDWKY